MIVICRGKVNPVLNLFLGSVCKSRTGLMTVPTLALYPGHISDYTVYHGKSVYSIQNGKANKQVTYAIRLAAPYLSLCNSIYILAFHKRCLNSTLLSSTHSLSLKDDVFLFFPVHRLSQYFRMRGS